MYFKIKNSIYNLSNATAITPYGESSIGIEYPGTHGGTEYCDPERQDHEIEFESPVIRDKVLSAIWEFMLANNTPTLEIE